MNGRGSDGGEAGSRRPGRFAVLASTILHVVVAFGILFTGLGSRMPEMVAYQIDLVSPPPREAGEPQEAIREEPPPVVRETAPEPEAAAEQPRAEPAPQEPRPEPTPPQPRPAETRPTPPAPTPERRPETRREEPPPEPVRGERPDARSPGGDDIEVRIDGEAFPFPGYLENITRQIRRHFRWTGQPGLSAEVYFVIGRDGTTSEIRLLRGSGNVQFDFEAMGAIEQAGRRGAFGPLPDGFRAERLPISFFFEPPR